MESIRGQEHELLINNLVIPTCFLYCSTVTATDLLSILYLCNHSLDIQIDRLDNKQTLTTINKTSSGFSGGECLTSAPEQLKMPTTLTGTSLLTQRPRAFLPKANTNGISCSLAMAMTLYKASSKPPATQQTITESTLHLCAQYVTAGSARSVCPLSVYFKF